MTPSLFLSSLDFTLLLPSFSELEEDGVTQDMLNDKFVLGHKNSDSDKSDDGMAYS